MTSSMSPRPARNVELPRIVSVFSGAGGLDRGFKDAGFGIDIAFDSSAAAVESHRRNFRRTKSFEADLVKLGAAGVVEHVEKVIGKREHIGVIGGPPCQGFSRANTGSHAHDPRNGLPKLYLDIVRELQKRYVVDFVVFENVLGMRDSKHASTYRSVVQGLEKLGFDVSEMELCALDYGVPQMRRRLILSGLRRNVGFGAVRLRKRTGARTVRDVIDGLPSPAFFSPKLEPRQIPAHPNHWTMNPKSPRFSGAKPGKDGRSFKRLDWDKPSPTIAFGHREIHVHPDGRRRLSIYEALRLQGFPSTFVLKGNLSQQVEQVSNAVPPPLALSVAYAIRRAIVK
jgi:DNA (cytosine-5)-methyltransferase 1